MGTFRTYRLAITLITSIIAGGAVGEIAPATAATIKPLGDLFLNLIFMIIVPLVFFAVSSSVASARGSNISRITWSMLAPFLFTSLVAAIGSLLFMLVVQPTPGANIVIKALPPPEFAPALGQLVSTVTTPDFMMMLSHKAMLPLMLFAAALGLATRQLGAEGEPVARLLRSGAQVTVKMFDYIMYIAPLGLFAYFAATVAQTGTQLASAYTGLVTAYYLFGVVYFFAGFSIYAWLGGGSDGVRRFWSQMLAPSLTALGTCSSMATMPVNLEAAPRMGVPHEVSDIVIPIGAVIHKDGSVIGGVAKVLFTMSLFHMQFTPSRFALAIGVALLVGVVIGAIPSGGATGELVVLSVFGMGLEALPLLMVISILIDPLATLLNATGDNVAAMMVTRLVQGGETDPLGDPNSY
jgi:Na+/H+-dicarboxylate symporter